MAPYLFWELVILIVGVWLIAVLCFAYGWLLLKRQQRMIQDLFVKLNLPSSLPQKQEKSVPKKEPVNLVISKNEPMSKYKDMEPDESVTVSFSDEEQ